MDIRATSGFIFNGRCFKGLKYFHIFKMLVNIKVSRILILLSLLYQLTACTTEQVRIEEQPQSLNEIRKAIISMIGKPRGISQNQREIYSNYFPRKGTTDFNPAKSKERLTAVFKILGDRRPFDITIQVVVEEKIEGEYEVIGDDNSIAENLKSELTTRLHQSLENRNVIDDFRAF